MDRPHQQRAATDSDLDDGRYRLGRQVEKEMDRTPRSNHRQRWTEEAVTEGIRFDVRRQRRRLQIRLRDCLQKDLSRHWCRLDKTDNLGRFVAVCAGKPLADEDKTDL